VNPHCAFRLLLAALFGVALHATALAHKSSDAYLQLTRTESGVTLRVDVALRDLDLPLDLDADGDAKLTWAEVKQAWPAIDRYALERLRLDGCELVVDGHGLERRTDGAYAVLHLTTTCRPADVPAVHYTLLREIDPTHRGLLKIEWVGAASQLVVLDPTRPMPMSNAAQAASGARAESGAGTETPGTPASFFGEGIHHIVAGYDHVLFLLCLLLPSVMRRTPTGWQPVGRLAQAVLPVAAIVTAFTVAHSITLALAAMKWVSLPPWFIEPAIAVTIVLAALDNLRPVFHGRRVLVTFLFGLIHGFGFAGVLGELNLPTTQFAWALLQFNLGLEFGQLLIVVLVAGVLYALRERPRYPAWAIRGGSMAAMLVGVIWFVERTADVSLLGWL
jgi:HupE / UreJ protein